MNLHRSILFFMLLFLTTNAFANDLIQETPDSATKKEPLQTTWFTHKKIDTDIWLINDNQQDNIYLIEGEALALVIDTGLGYQNLKAYIETITDKPLVVVNSHAHPDHAGGNHVFEQVHIHKDELETLKHYTSEPVMADTFKRFVKKDMPEHLLDKNKTSPSLITIEDGFKFDLGNKIIDVVHIPGHTPGSIALYDRKSKNMFTGDMANEHIWLQVKHVTSVKDFLNSIRTLQTYSASIDRLLPGHGEPLSPDHLNTLEAAAEKLLSGACAVTPYSSPLGEEISCRHEGVVLVYKK
jgi:hydroxyacylglutathione hydrolase